jgi:ATP-dependent DNA helicase DinG
MAESTQRSPDEIFPFPSYRPYQRAALYEASTALFEDNNIETVVLNLPTGIGKSAINTALARQAESAFLTTPQKALRSQLENDSDLREYYSVLRARNDYSCPAGSIYGSNDTDTTGAEGYTCKDCPINQDDDESCLDYSECTYWTRKQDAMGDAIAVLTFSYLVIDDHLPKLADVGEGRRMVGDTPDKSPNDLKQVSFGDRDLLIVDECHKLEGQVASLHAGITVSPYSLPMGVFQQVDRKIGDLPDDRVTKLEDIREHLDNVHVRAKQYIQNHSDRAWAGEDDSQDVRNCRSFCQKYAWCREQLLDGRDWVVDREEVTYHDAVRYSIQIKPVDVDEFLQDHVWSRANKQVLSTATMPFSSTPERWLERLGLDPEKARVVQYPMPFPADQRPIHTETVVGKMSQGGYEDHRTGVVERLRALSRKHRGERGLVHTASYDRAQDLHRRFSENSQCHTRHRDVDLWEQIDEWQASDDDLFFSPAAMDGVDLPGDECRWQVLLKVPYPQPSDPRVRFLLDEREAWDWYYEVTCQDVQQSVGRGVRSMDDECEYYVLDASFFDVLQRVSVPDWFDAAIRSE